MDRIAILAEELKVEADAALARLEGAALAAFRIGDRERILALVDERAHLDDLAASLARWSDTSSNAPEPPRETTVAPIVAPEPAPAPPPSRERFAAREEGAAPAPPSVTGPKEPVAVALKPLSDPRPAPQPTPSVPQTPPAVQSSPNGKPVRVKPERPAKPVPEGPLEGRTLTATRTRFFEESRNLLARPGSGAIRAARFKSAISMGRALAETLPDPELVRLVNEENRALREAWNAEIAHDFFGLNPGRHIEAEGWYRLSRAFALTAEAEEALSAVTDETAIGPTREAAADAIAAAVGLAQGTMAYYAEGTTDAEVNALRKALEGFGRLPRAQEIREAIRRKPLEWPRYEEMAAGLPALAKRLRTEGERRSKGEAALAAFEHEMKDGAADEEFVDRLVGTAKSALTAGVRPNAPRLRDPMMAYAEVLKEPDTASDPALKPLIAEIAKQATLLAARKTAVIESDLHAEDPEHEARLAAVRSFLAGKSLGFAGSRRGIDRKVQEFGRTLGAKDVVWPDVEKHQAVGSLVEALKDCDVVCLIVRFCRHSYKDALDRAKKGGARLVFLPRGLGLNTVVYELFTQLQLGTVPNDAEAA